MILRGNKVTLTPVQTGDAPLLTRWYGDLYINRFTTRKKPTLKRVKQKIREIQKMKDSYQFMVKTDQGLCIGTASLLRQGPGDQSMVIGLMIGNKDYWSKGYGSDIIDIILRFGFGKLKLHRIEADIFEYNFRAIGLCKKFRFKREGIRREQIFYGGTWHDVIHFGLLRKEWNQ